MRNVSYEEEFVVINPNEESILKKNDEPISMIVGIKDLISVLIEFEHINYGIHGTLKGFVSFGKVNLLITKMEVQLIKKETIFGSKTQKKGNPKIIATFELIDGGPYRNETIPFRFFLEPYHLTPSYIDVSGYFSVRYYLNLVIKDNQNNRYFKQKEIFLHRLYLPDKNNSSDLSNNNSLNNSLSDVNHLKDYITEPIDYGDYFSVFNDIDEDNDDSNEPNKEEEEDDFYYRSNLTGFTKDENEEKKRRKKRRKKRLSKLRSDNVFEENKASLPVFEDNTNRSILNDNNYNDYNNNFNNNYDNNNYNYNENNNINNDNNYNDINNDNNYNNINNDNDANGDVNEKINRMINENNNNLINNISNDNNNNNKTSGSKAPKKEKKRKNQVINIKETNKYKNNDILINDNYYSTDNYIIYENSYHNIFDDKLKQSRIKYTKLSEKNSMEDNEDEKEKEKGIKMIDDNSDYNIKDNKEISTLNNINDYNLYYPNEPFSNTLIMSNFPSNYGESGQSGNFRQNLMGSRIKKK